MLRNVKKISDNVLDQASGSFDVYQMNEEKNIAPETNSMINGPFSRILKLFSPKPIRFIPDKPDMIIGDPSIIYRKNF